MARIKIEKVVDKLSIKMRKALAATVENVIDDADFDEYELFREFKREVNRKCSTWETVPEQYVDKN